MSLSTLSPSIIQPLQYVTRHPASSRVPPPQASYAPLEPALRLFLSRNQLRSLPRELFHLHNLTVLSLRENNLDVIPPSICTLRNLVDLSLGGNRLQWLPFELLDLLEPQGRLKFLRLFPNPLFDFDNTVSLDLEEQQAGRLLESAKELDQGWPTRISISERQLMMNVEWYPRYLVSAPVTFHNIDGSLHRLSPPSMISSNPESSRRLPITLQRAYQSPNPSERTRVPSLAELALRRCSDSPSLEQLGDYLPSDYPTSLSRMLRHAANLKATGGQRCTICSREFILPRTEWMEWWDCEQSMTSGYNQSTGSRVPLLRRGCSWKCVPH